MVPRRIPRQARGETAKREVGEGRPVTLTQARLNWLEVCGRARTITAKELQLAIQLALNYVPLPKSRERFDKTGVPVAWPPQVELANALGCTRQAVSAAARRLEKRGYIAITPGGGRGHATEYELLQKGKQSSCSFNSEKGQRCGSEKANGESGKGKYKPHKRQTSSLPHSYSMQSIDQSNSHSMMSGCDGSAGVKRGKYPEFEEIFEFWPNRKKDHDKAEGAWVNHVVKRSIDPQLVLKRAKQWCAFWNWEGEDFHTYLGKWLKEHLWEDRPPARKDELSKMVACFDVNRACARPWMSSTDDEEGGEDDDDYSPSPSSDAICDPDED